MTHTDRYSLPLTTGSAVAADFYRDGVDLLLALWPGADGPLDRALLEDPQFALAIAAHRQQLGDSTTALDDSLWAAANHARERARRSRVSTPGWHRARVFTTQLIDAGEEHRRLNGAPRPADAVLYGLLHR